MALFLRQVRTASAPGPSLGFSRYGSKNAGSQVVMPRMPPQQAPRVAMKDLENLPGDMGLLPDTFVMPTGSNLPSAVSSPAKRLRLEIDRLRHRLSDLAGLVVYRYTAKTKLRLREPKVIAKPLHRDMYTAFAQRDLETLRMICGEGLLQSFAKRLFTRGQMQMEWKLHRYVRSIRIVSNKAACYAGMSLFRRQAVVRIHSVQSLTKLTPRGSVVEGSGQPKEVLEYLVLEKRKIDAQESPWFIWGTTQETKAKI